MLSLVIAALLPSLVLIGYVCFKDRRSPEPAGWLLKAFVLGMLSADASLLISQPLQMLGAFSAEPVSVWDHFRVAFFGAGVPEEIAKLFMLWLVLRKNPHYDENFDGIVYAVCVGMGFAFVENIGYLMNAGEYWVHAGIARSLISVPGHYAFAVLMGFYYSYACFGNIKYRKLYKFLTLAAPIAAHTAFDWILMVSDAVEYQAVSAVLTALFFVGFVKLQKIGSKRIATQLSNDSNLF